MEELEIIYQDNYIIAINKPTSGVPLFALNRERVRALSEQMKSGGLTKQSPPFMWGYADEQGRIDYARKKVLDKMTDAKARQDKRAEEAVTVYEKIDQFGLTCDLNIKKSSANFKDDHEHS
ncbi:MAG: hypothetical protein PF439_12265 [Helicobacteraceae bacterium]|jgi:23S rRNA-/tRNA-specific pseudouridylate synthase|nr:hypothetical protein [Helicobacteraceae bacterium]